MRTKNLDKKARCWFIDCQRWILRGNQIYQDVEICTDVLTFCGNVQIQGAMGDREEARRIRNQAITKVSQEKRYIIQKEKKRECDKRIHKSKQERM